MIGLKCIRKADLVMAVNTATYGIQHNCKNWLALASKKATKFVQELIFNAIMGVSLVALIFGFVILIKVLIG